MEVQCCMCRKFRNGNEWTEGAPNDAAKVSHGYCPECAARMMHEILLMPRAEAAKRAAH